jgi:hypothetical protein
MGFGQLGAQGVEGGRALAISLDRRTFDDVEWRRSDEEHLQRAVKYLARKAGGAGAMQAHGITADPVSLTDWLSQAHTPSPDRQQRLQLAFRELRRHNIAPHLTRVLNADGGTRIEIHPVDQEYVETRYVRYLRARNKNIYRWNAIVQAWARQDSMALEDLWQGVISDMDSDYRKYEYVEHIGILG